MKKKEQEHSLSCPNSYLAPRRTIFNWTMHVKIVRLAIYVRVGEVHVQVQGQADHQVQGQVGDEISVVSIDHDIVRSAKRRENDVPNAKRGENAKGPPNNLMNLKQI